MFDQMTLPGIGNATSLPGWVAGPSPPVSPDGQKTGKSGQPLADASRSRSQAKAPELLMRGTYGPTFSASPVPGGPLSSWENRLRQRLARIGSSECDLTWKASAMSDGVLLSRLVPSTPRTVEIDSGLLLEAAYWPTATAVDGARGLTTRPQDTGIPLPQRVGQVLGIAPAGSSATTAKRGVLNPAFPCWLMGYPLAHLSCGAMAMRLFQRWPQKS